jgi:hypothetical protein
MNHQGTPFSIGTIQVSAPISGAAAAAASASEGAFTARISICCAPSSSALSDAATE